MQLELFDKAEVTTPETHPSEVVNSVIMSKSHNIHSVCHVLLVSLRHYLY